MDIHEPGIYVLLIGIGHEMEVGVGCLGHRSFPKGWYAYVGSAQGGIWPRVSRHISPPGAKKNHWHIDYLLEQEDSCVRSIFMSEGERHRECQVACRLAEEFECVEGFGSSDCGCVSHLFHAGDLGALEGVLDDICPVGMKVSSIIRH